MVQNFLKRQGSNWFKKSVAFGLTMTFSAGISSNCANAMEEVPSKTRIFEKSKEEESEERKIIDIHRRICMRCEMPQNFRDFGFLKKILFNKKFYK